MTSPNKPEHLSECLSVTSSADKDELQFKMGVTMMIQKVQRHMNSACCH